MSDRTPGTEPEGLPPEQLPPVSGPLTGNPPSPEPAAAEIPPPPRQNQIIREIMRGSVVTTILAIVLAMVVGGILIAITDPDVQAASGYFFARPQDTFAAIWNSVYGAYEALFRGSIFNARVREC